MFKDSYHNLKIVDLGLATPINVEKFIYPKCGTPGYVAPEIANLKNLEEKYDQLCDIFSIGAIFYKMFFWKYLILG
jgi:serine/threonine protein kinase